jgi:hypothetical protein
MEDLQKEFIPYELALRLKALGFDDPCFAQFYKHPTQEKEEFRLFQDCVWENRTTSYWRTNISSHFVSAPTFSQAFRWFREKYELYSWVQLHNGYIDDSFYKKLPITWTIMEHESGKQYYERDIDHNYLYHTYEEAELACLTKLIEIVEQKQT